MTLADPLDPQKDLVYAAEWAAPSYNHNIHFGSLYDAKACFKSILKSKVWANKFKVQRELKLDFAVDSTLAGRYWPSATYMRKNGEEYTIPYGRIVLYSAGMNLHVLLHEMAHHVAAERYPKSQHHGPKFAWYLVAMISCFFSREVGAGLALSMKIHGVRAKK